MSHFCRTFAAAATVIVGLLPSFDTWALSPGQMMQKCRIRAGEVFRTRLPNIDTKYEGQRVDGTHAVNGTAIFAGRTETFQCSFDKPGDRIIQFVVNQNSGAAQQPSKPPPSHDALVPGTEFHATGTVPCARNAGQPMGQCQFGVVREGNGSGRVTIFWPDGGNRVIFFEGGAPKSYDESQADGGAEMKVRVEAGLFTITIGDQRFEITDTVILGG